MPLILDDIVQVPDGESGALRRATLRAMRARPDWQSWNSRLPDPADWIAFAERNRVGPIVAHALRDLGRETSESRGIHDKAAARMRALMDALDLVAARLARQGIPLVALKNAGIARGIYPCAACCPMGDIDTLVCRDRFREAHAIVLECGFELATRAAEVEPADIEHGLASGGTEYVRHFGENEVWLELQWRAVAGRWIRRDQEPDTRTLMDRSVAIADTEVRLLAPEDNMVQVGLHTAKHSYLRAPGLRLHTDVDRLAAYAPPSWDVVLDRARALSIKDALYFSFALAAALLDSNVPVKVLDELEPVTWKRAAVAKWIKHADVFEPDEHKFNRAGMMIFHALLYDSPSGLLASALDTDPSMLGIRHLPRNLKAGMQRIFDLATRYQR